MSEAGSTTATSVGALSRRVAAAANRVLAATRDAGRDDLVARVQEEAARWGQQDTSVVVVGGSRAGKTLLVDALCGAPVLPAGTETTTHVLVRAADESALLVHLDDRGEPLVVDPATVPAWLAQGEGVLDLHAPGVELPTGLVLVDTPAVDAVDDRRRDRALEALSFADAAIVCIPATAPITGPDLQLVRRLAERVDHVVVAYTRIDRLRGWERIVEDSNDLLARELPDPHRTHVAVSARLAALCWEEPLPPAAERDELLAESGIDELRALLRGRVVGRVELVRLGNLIRVARNVVDQLVVVERATLNDLVDAQTSPAMAELEAAQAELEALGRDSSGWLVDFGDQLSLLRDSLMTDLSRTGTAALTDVSHRMESGELDAADADAELDAVLDDAADELRRRAEDGAREAVRQAIDAVAGAAVMQEELGALLGGEAPDDDGDAPGRQADSTATSGKRRDLASMTRVGAMVASSGSGVAMMLMSIGPPGGGAMAVARGMAFGVAALLGAASGAAAMRQGKRQRAQQEARLAGRQLVDDWRSELGTQLRRTLLRIQRETERELKALILERRNDVQALVRAKQASARSDAAERKARVAGCQESLARLGQLQDELAALAADVAAATPSRA